MVLLCPIWCLKASAPFLCLCRFFFTFPHSYSAANHEWHFRAKCVNTHGSINNKCREMNHSIGLFFKASHVYAINVHRFIIFIDIGSYFHFWGVLLLSICIMSDLWMNCWFIFSDLFNPIHNVFVKHLTVKQQFECKKVYWCIYIGKMHH